jgi:hypothetical protein
MSSTSNTGEKSPLDAAQKIVSELAGMKADHQTLALRFAMETLGLHVSGAPVIAAQGIQPATQAAQPALAAQPFGNTDHSTNIRSFTAMKAPKSDRQFTAVVAYFYQFEAKPEDRKETINSETMKEAARLAGWPQVARWSMTLTNAKNAGYLDAAGNGLFKLSSVGENLVAITLPGNDAAAKGNPTTKTSKKKAAKRSPKKKR